LFSLFFFSVEGDEPLLAYVSVRNAGASAIVFRVQSSTPTRFSIHTPGGVLEPGGECSVPVELKSFPAHLLATPFASFNVDFSNFADHFSANDIDGFFNSLGECYIRKAVEARAVPYDGRQAAEGQGRLSDPAEEAPTDHDGYTVHAAGGLSMASRDGDASSSNGLNCSNIHGDYATHDPVLYSDNEDDRDSSDSMSSSLSGTPRRAGDGTVDQGRFPNTTVTPKCIYFLGKFHYAWN
jgi:hypothetical protein